MSLPWSKYIAVIGSEITLRTLNTDHKKNDQGEQIVNLSALADRLDKIARSKLPLLDTLTLLVGYPYVNYLVLPWQDAILTPMDRLDYAESLLEHEYGIARTASYSEIVQSRFASTAITTAVQRDVVDEIVAICKKRKIRLTGVRTLLTEAIANQRINPHNSSKLNDDAVFIAHQTNADAFAFRRDGQWCHTFTLQNTTQSAEQRLMSACVMANHFPENKYVTNFGVIGADHATA